MDIPGFRLHALKGDKKGRWSIFVNGNWRLTFEFIEGDAYVLDYEAYHCWHSTIRRTPASSSVRSTWSRTG